MAAQSNPRRRSRLTRPSRPRRLLVEPLEGRILLAGVPELSSLPGANHTIYLDFDGHVVQNTSWNSYYNQSTLSAPAYDIDGNPSSFSATELARIEEAWKRTAEDFSSFNVNVTTVDPGIEPLRKSGTTDAQWGVRVIVTNETNMVTTPAERCGCGGIAYIDSFNWSSDTPVWVFTTGGKSVAEAASHEVGHSLGLAHDGTASSGYYQGHGSGDTSWAPIMGVGYYSNVTQWDRGEYTGSNNAASGANYNKGPDDLAIITTYNGFGYRSDDHGNNNSNASVLAQTGTTVSGAGIIETSSDVDVLSFTTGSGPVTLNIVPFTPGPNLDIHAQIYDASGNLVASSNPVSGLSASFALSLAAGQYFVHVDGTGVGNPAASPPTGYSDYASLGQYTISGTVVEASSLPVLAINDVTVNEADGSATFTVSITGTLSDPISVDFATADGSASAGSDYTAASGTLTFLPGGATTQSISVSILDDAVGENTENFVVNLSNASGAVISDGQGQGTIQDEDVGISINDASTTEGNLTKGTRRKPGTPTYKSLAFTISLSAASSQSVSVAYATQDGTATTANNDYQTASGSVTFSPGETSKTISVTIVGDNTAEPHETFSVVLSNPVGAGLADGIGIGTILDNDGGGSAGTNPDEAEPIAVADPFWFFEAPDGSELAHDHNHDHDHDHEHPDFGHDPHDATFDGLAGLSPVVSSSLDSGLLGERAPVERGSVPASDVLIATTTVARVSRRAALLHESDSTGPSRGHSLAARDEQLNDVLFGELLAELLPMLPSRSSGV